MSELSTNRLGYAINSEDREYLEDAGANVLQTMKAFRETFPVFNPHADPLGAVDVLDQGGQGACFPSGTKITLASGDLKAVEDVKYGDTVLTHLGRARQVIDVMSRPFTGDLYRVFVKGWGSISLTDDHVVRVSRDGQLIWSRADNLLKTDQMVVSRGVEERPLESVDVSDYVSDLYLDGDMVSSKHSPGWVNRFIPLDDLTCYVLGLYCAEGSTDRTSGGKPNRAVWTMHADEEFEHSQVEKFAGRLGAGFVKQARTSSKAVNLRVASPVFARFVELVCGKFCNYKKVPEFILTARSEQKLAFVRGYFAGDGSLGKVDQVRTSVSGNAVKILQIHSATASRVLAQQVSTLLVSLGFKPGRTLTKSRPHQRYSSYQTYLYSNDALRFLGRDSHPTSGKRPQHKSWSEEGQLREIRTITHNKVENLPVYDFTVAEDHSFVAQGMVVHNCQGHSLATMFSICFFLATGRRQAFSRACGYYVSQSYDNIRGDNGSTLSAGMKVATKHGMCIESDWPYPSRYDTRMPTGIQFPYKLTATKPIRTMADFVAWTDLNLPVQDGFAWNDTCSKEVVDNYQPLRGSGGHSTAFWQKKPNGNFVKINSWGSRWSLDGCNEWTPRSIERILADSMSSVIGYAPSEMSFPDQEPIR